ncbi:tail protein X [Sphingomonas sp. PR090111-T3T-6A]|uniref:tail protein X n=1 Tax=Sphingomonas sp. PR090111-T3T-6A TaxID=685778 RepID=UPI00037EDD53|nr:tail protein X [Sphingomonas sp. PR090111-T3T-6A]
MADTVITALSGEGLDELTWRAIGSNVGLVEGVLDTNPGLAARALAGGLPENHPVTVPASAPTTDTLPEINLWD